MSLPWQANFRWLKFDIKICPAELDYFNSNYRQLKLAWQAGWDVLAFGQLKMLFKLDFVLIWMLFLVVQRCRCPRQAEIAKQIDQRSWSYLFVKFKLVLDVVAFRQLKWPIKWAEQVRPFVCPILVAERCRCFSHAKIDWKIESNWAAPNWFYYHSIWACSSNSFQQSQRYLSDSEI